jgi:hypothetical protein
MMKMKLRTLAFALTLAGTVFARSPMPSGLRGFLAQPPTTTERECADADDPKCVKRTYTITVNVNEKFVRLPLAQQTTRVVGMTKWFLGAFAEQFPINDDVGFVFYAALNKQVLGWSDGGDWVWDANYAAEINRRAIRGGK